MNRYSRLGPVAAASIAALLMTACSSTRPLPYAGLPSSQRMTANTDAQSDKVPYVYSSNVDWRAYSRAIVDPVTVYGGADHQFEDVPPEEQLALARYMESEFRKAVSQRFVAPPRNDQKTLRIRATLTGASLTTRGLSTFLRFDLGGAPYNAVQSARDKEGLMTGTVSYAVEITDADTQQLLYAYVAKQYPNAYNVAATLGKLDASKVGIDKAAEDLVARLQQGGAP